MIDNIIVFRTILSLFGVLLLFYVVGLSFNYILNRQKAYWGWIPSYLYLFCGMLISVSFLAIYKTKCQTVLILIPIFLSLFSILFHKNFVFQVVKKRQKIIEPFIFLLLSVAIYYIYYFQSFDDKGNVINYIYGDVEYYARVAQNISQLGIENMRVEYLNPERFSVEPYHYGDLWTIALVTNVAEVLPVYATILIATPLLLGIGSLGAAALIHHFILKGNHNGILLLVLLLGFVGGFSIFFPKFLFPGSVDVYVHSLSNYTKLAWWASMLPIIFVLLINKNDRLIPYIVFIIGLGYINVLPSLLLASFLWLAYIGLKRVSFKKHLLTITILTLMTFGFFYIFYSIIPYFADIDNNLSPKATFSIKSVITNLKTSLNIFIGGGLQFLVYLPVVLLFFIYYKIEGSDLIKSPLINIIIFSLLSMFSALCVWSLLFTTTFEAIQFFYNVFVVIAGLLSIVIYIYIVVNSQKIWIQFAAVLLLVVSVIDNLKYTINVKSITKHEKNIVFDFIDSQPRKTFAYYQPLQDYTSDVFASSTIVAIPMSFLGYKIVKYQNFSLNVPFAKLDSTKREFPFQLNNIAWAPMSYFVKIPENALLTEEELMKKFMYKNDIGFLCLPINVTIPNSLSEYLVDSLYAPITGWKIYSCKYRSDFEKLGNTQRYGK